MKTNIRKKLLLFLLLLSSISAIAEKEKEKERNLYPIPIIFASSDVGIGYGAQLMYVERSEDGILDGELQGILTTKDQKQLILNLKKELYESGYIFELSTSVVDWKSPFHGIGNNTPEDALELYTSKEFGFSTGIKKEFAEAQYIGIEYLYRDLETTDLEAGGLLDSGDYNENGKVSGIGLNYTYDMRDNPRNTKNGYVMTADSKYYNDIIQSDYDFYTLSFDTRAYKEVAPEKVIGLQLYTSQSTGNVPLDYLESLGSGSLLRGYLSKRYVDKAKLAIQGEYRFPITGKFTGVAFASTGQVAEEVSDFHMNEMKSTVGAGIKYVISERDGIKIRLDIGVNQDGSMAFYIDFGDAF